MGAGRERAVAVCGAAGDIERMKEAASRRGIEIVETLVGPGRIAQAAGLIRQGKATAAWFATLAGLGNSAAEAVGAFAEIRHAGGVLVCLDPDFDTGSPVDRGIAVFAVALAGLGAGASSEKPSGRAAGALPDYRRRAVLAALGSGVPVGQVARSFGIQRREVEKLAAGLGLADRRPARR
jgi:hypothetical protein